MRLLVRGHLLEVPFEERQPAVGLAVGPVGAAVGGRGEVCAPAPHHRPQHLGGRVRRLDRRGVIHGALPDLVVGGRRRVDVAVGAVPEHGLVVQGVEPDPALGCGAVPGDEVVDPVGDEIGADGDGGVRRVVARDLRPARENAVAGVGAAPVGVAAGAALGLGLGAVLLHREAPADRTVPGDPADERHRQEHLAAGVQGLVDEHVGGRVVGQTLRVGIVFGDVQEEPVHGPVAGVGEPRVARGVIAAPAAHREAGRIELGRLAEADPVDERVDGPAVGGRIDTDGNGRGFGWRAGAFGDEDVVDIHRRLVATGTVLQAEAVHHAGRQAQVRERHPHVHPLSARQDAARQVIGQRRRARQRRAGVEGHGESLAAGGAAVDPEVERLVRVGCQAGVHVKVDARPAVGLERYGRPTGVDHRRLGQAARGPAPVLKAVAEPVVVDDAVCPTGGRNQTELR